MNEFGDLEIRRIGDCDAPSQSPNHSITKSLNGVTLLEMLIVVALIGLLVSISFPSVSAGVDTLRLTSAGESLASFLNGALNRAERSQQAVEVTIDPQHGLVEARSAAPGFQRRLELSGGIRIWNVLPAPPVDTDEPRRFVVYPGGTAPRVAIELTNPRGARRIVSIDPITGVPAVERIP
jgi:prepilin-type N-terminal cleavage/methylation domain-containing protein